MGQFTIEALPEFAQQFIKEMQQKGRKGTSVKRYIYDLIDYFHWLEKEKGIVGFEEWAALDIEDYVEFFSMLRQERESSKRTLHRFRTVLNQLTLYYRERNYDVCTPGIIVIESLMRDSVYQKEDFITEKEYRYLKQSIVSPVGLSEKRLLARPFLINRNLSIITLFAEYGLTMHELSELVMKNVDLVSKRITVSREGYERVLDIDPKDALLLNYYLKDIPKTVRPRVNGNDPLFVAFDFYRGTYHWDYPNTKPKGITEVSIQKMIRGEIKKAAFHRQVSARNLRNTSILNEILQGKSKEELFERFGFKTDWYINRYLQYAFKIDPSLKEIYLETTEKKLNGA